MEDGILRKAGHFINQCSIVCVPELQHGQWLGQSVVIKLAALATLASNLYPQRAFKIPWKPRESSG